jgi:hypothetical protein
MANTQPLDNRVVNVQDLTRAVQGSENAINARIDEMQRAVELFQADLTRVPTAMDRAVGGLRELLEAQLQTIEAKIALLHDVSLGETRQLSAVMGERFTGVSAQFSERDKRTELAFAAAKEATAKIEAGFTRQIDAMSGSIDTKTGNLVILAADLKERIVAIDARTQGVSAANQDRRLDSSDSRNLLFGIFGTVIGAVGILVALFVHGPKG